MNAAAVSEQDGRPVIVSGINSPDMIDLRGSGHGAGAGAGPELGETVLGPFTGHDGPVNTVAAGLRRARPVIVAGGDYGTVRVWDLESGRQVLGALDDGLTSGRLTNRVNAVATGKQLDGTPVIVAGGDDGTIRV